MSLKPEAAFTIRPAKQKEAGAIRQLILHSGINPTGLDWRRFLVAVSSPGQFIGCGQVKPHGDGSQELASLAVTKGWRGRGVGSALIEALLSKHPGELHLMCQSSLGPLYQRYGFEAIAEEHMPTYFRRVSKLAGVLENLRQQGETLLIMRKAGQ